MTNRNVFSNFSRGAVATGMRAAGRPVWRTLLSMLLAVPLIMLAPVAAQATNRTSCPSNPVAAGLVVVYNNTGTLCFANAGHQEVYITNLRMIYTGNNDTRFELNGAMRPSTVSEYPRNSWVPGCCTGETLTYIVIL
jgi:hypothetical protein